MLLKGTQQVLARVLNFVVFSFFNNCLTSQFVIYSPCSSVFVVNFLNYFSLRLNLKTTEERVILSSFEAKILSALLL